MNIIVDIGNTLTKVSVVQNGSIVDSHRINTITTEIIKEIISKYPSIDKMIVSSVKKEDELFINNVKNPLSFFLELGPQTPLPIEILYESPETLGNDRIAGAIGANNIFPSQNVLIIDAGSAITFDFVNTKNQYEGGTISPGIQMRYKALHHFTSKLPLMSVTESETITGKTTEEAITSGVQNGIIFEVRGYINKYIEKHPDIKIIITGGDAIFFDKKLKNSIFVDLNLVTVGLNRILEYNAEKK